MECSLIDDKKTEPKSSVESLKRNLDMYSYRVSSPRRIRGEPGKKLDLDVIHKDLTGDSAERQTGKPLQFSISDQKRSPSPSNSVDDNTTQPYNIYDATDIEISKEYRQHPGGDIDDGATQPYDVHDTFPMTDIDDIELDSPRTHQSPYTNTRCLRSPDNIPYSCNDTPLENTTKLYSPNNSKYLKSPGFWPFSDSEDGSTSPAHKDPFPVVFVEQNPDQHLTNCGDLPSHDENIHSPPYRIETTSVNANDPTDDADTQPYSINDPINPHTDNSILKDIAADEFETHFAPVILQPQPQPKSKYPENTQLTDQLNDDDVISSQRTRKQSFDLSSFELPSQLSFEYTAKSPNWSPSHDNQATDICIKKSTIEEWFSPSPCCTASRSPLTDAQLPRNDANYCDNNSCYILQKRSYDGSFDEDAFDFNQWDQSPTNVSFVQHSESDEDTHGPEYTHTTMADTASPIYNRSHADRSLLSMASWSSVSTIPKGLDENVDTLEIFSSESLSLQTMSSSTLQLPDEETKSHICSSYPDTASQDSCLGAVPLQRKRSLQRTRSLKEVLSSLHDEHTSEMDPKKKNMHIETGHAKLRKRSYGLKKPRQ
ncbi:hypothetical protein DFQ30_002258 [Apophysomyces sp. BC1015]|nr:hypothetical protein DFQ30_002258 [Apophysomyces sp. BC1015]KAG0180026.1 hypothetical protein DFQ29_001330 [Apophysomyces sp. BC1021]